MFLGTSTLMKSRWPIISLGCLVAATAGSIAGYAQDVDPWQLERERERAPGESDSYYLDVLHARELLDNDQHEESRALFAELMQRSATAANRREMAGFVTATYFDEGDHRSGLDFICELYREEPAWSRRYRFAIQAHVRNIGNREGLQTAAQVAEQYRRRCGRPDFTPIWAGVGLEMMRELQASHPLPNSSYELSEEDRAFLLQFVDAASDAPFLDYALYFLEEYDAVLSFYPDSDITDTAELSAALAEPDETRRLERLATYLDRWPTAPGAALARSELADAYIALGQLAQAGLLRNVELNDWNMAAEDVGSQFYRKSSAVLARNLNSMQLDALIDALHRIGETYARESMPPPAQFLVDRSVLSDLVSRISGATPQQLFETALLVRDAADSVRFEKSNKVDRLGVTELSFDWAPSRCGLGDDAGEVFSLYVLANRLLSAVVDLEPNGDLAPKALYILGVNLRKIECYGNAADTFGRIAQAFPMHPLADDALAEQVFFHIAVQNDAQQAEAAFDVLRNRYPHANAVDNAANWLAYYYLAQGSLGDALGHFTLIASEFARQRFGAAASETKKRIERVEALLAQPGARLGLDVTAESHFDPTEMAPYGFRILVKGIQAESRAATAGFQAGDVIEKVGDSEADDMLTFLEYVAQGPKPLRFTVRRELVPISATLDEILSVVQEKKRYNGEVYLGLPDFENSILSGGTIVSFGKLPGGSALKTMDDLKKLAPLSSTVSVMVKIWSAITLELIVDES